MWELDRHGADAQGCAGCCGGPQGWQWRCTETGKKRTAEREKREQCGDSKAGWREKQAGGRPPCTSCAVARVGIGKVEVVRMLNKAKGAIEGKARGDKERREGQDGDRGPSVGGPLCDDFREKSPKRFFFTPLPSDQRKRCAASWHAGRLPRAVEVQLELQGGEREAKVLARRIASCMRTRHKKRAGEW